VIGRRPAGKILVTPRSLTADGLSAPELEPLTAARFELVSGPPGRSPELNELLELVRPCVGWLAGVERIGRPVLEEARSLRVISRNGVGVDNIDLEAAEQHGVKVLRTPGANADAVAELTVGLMLSALRHIPASDRAIRAGSWQRHAGRELGSSTVGLVGLGVIGRTVARIVRGFGAVVVACDPMASSSAEGRLVDLDELLRISDVVTLHLPAQPDRSPLIGDRQLAAMRPGAVLVNTARASLVDQRAVLHALDDGRLGAYAVDVFDREPPAPSWLYRHENVIATPHIGGFTHDGVRRATQAAVTNLLEALSPQLSRR
jgi:D-3-phosphoglycerate dehydrogenase